MIRTSLGAIQAKTCIQFQEASDQPSSQYIFYQTTNDAGICGQSPLGMQTDVNEIDLNFASSDQVMTLI